MRSRFGELYSRTFRNVLFPLWETGIRKRDTLSILAKLEQTQWLPASELRALQVEELQRLLRHAATHTSYYGEMFKRLGLSAGDFREVEDLAKLPILGREDAQNSFESRKSTAPPFPSLYKQSSGTSGRPLALMYDCQSEYWRQATKLRGWGWAGYTPGSTILILWGRHNPASRLQDAKIRFDRALRREVYVDCTQRQGGAINGWIEVIRRTRPSVITGYATAIVDLARHVNANSLRTWDDIAIISGAEKLHAHDRAEVIRAFGPGVFDTYGSREMMLMATECERHDGLHISAENIIVEIVVREQESVRPANIGEVGEVVVTDLHNLGMPFIRYANGDLASWSAPGKCGCGRELPRISSIEGRIVETLRDGRGGYIGGITISVAMVPAAFAVKEFQAVQSPDNELTLRVVRGAPYDASVEAGIRSRLEAQMSVPLRFEYVDQIELTAAGKRRMVVCHPPTASPATGT